MILGLIGNFSFFSGSAMILIFCLHNFCFNVHAGTHTHTHTHTDRERGRGERDVLNVHITYTAQALKMNDTLLELYLADNKLMPTDGIQLGNLLRYNFTLQLLDVRNNHLQVNIIIISINRHWLSLIITSNIRSMSHEWYNQNIIYLFGLCSIEYSTFMYWGAVC